MSRETVNFLSEVAHCLLNDLASSTSAEDSESRLAIGQFASLVEIADRLGGIEKSPDNGFRAHRGDRQGRARQLTAGLGS